MYCISSVCPSSCVSHADIKLVDEHSIKTAVRATHYVNHRDQTSAVRTYIVSVIKAMHLSVIEF